MQQQAAALIVSLACSSICCASAGLAQQWLFPTGSSWQRALMLQLARCSPAGRSRAEPLPLCCLMQPQSAETCSLGAAGSGSHQSFLGGSGGRRCCGSRMSRVCVAAGRIGRLNQCGVLLMEPAQLACVTVYYSDDRRHPDASSWHRTVALSAGSNKQVQGGTCCPSLH